MKKSEPKMFMNIAFESEEFEEKAKIAMDKYVEDVIYKNLDEEIMRIVDKRIDSLISANNGIATEKLNMDIDQRIEVVIEELEGECPF